MESTAMYSEHYTQTLIFDIERKRSRVGIYGKLAIRTAEKHNRVADAKDQRQRRVVRDSTVFFVLLSFFFYTFLCPLQASVGFSFDTRVTDWMDAARREERLDIIGWGGT